MKRIYSIIALVVITISFSQCTKETIDETVGVTNITDTIYYDTDIKPLIDANCIACHSGSNPSAGLNLSTYQVVKFQAESETLISRINDSTNPMPVSGLMSADSRGKFDKWETDGFLETK
jgi:hypothetical protein